MNDPRIAKLRQFAEKDLRVSDCACRLIFRAYSYVVCSSQPVNLPFALPWKQVADWCGLSDKDTCYDRIKELVDCGYLYDEGVKGCPPEKWVKLNLKLDLSVSIKRGFDGTTRNGVIPPTVRRLGNKDASKRKAIAAMRAAAK